MSLDEDFFACLGESAPRLVDSLERFAQVRVLVVGDLALDEFMTGEVERVSREAPVMILRHETTRQVPGGGANSVCNFAALGASVKAAGFVGDDDQGQAIRRIFSHMNVDTQGVMVDGDRPTVTKTRISGHARQSVTQQIVRIDRKSDAFPSLTRQQQLADYIRQQIDHVDCVVCSDYGDGVLTQAVIQASLAHALVVVDAQQALHRFAGATMFTPNLPEAEKAVGYAIADESSLYQAGNDLLRTTQADGVLITRGGDGMTFFDKTGHPQSIPAFNRTDVFDVTGAGDTVTAALTLALGTGASFWEATVLGNLAASIVVREFGTATTTVNAMKQALSALLLT
ncbi:MAG: PfkB family carbohydrate kinase [Cyanobacteria bacterium P01_E01_bin.6]